MLVLVKSLLRRSLDRKWKWQNVQYRSLEVWVNSGIGLFVTLWSETWTTFRKIRWICERLEKFRYKYFEGNAKVRKRNVSNHAWKNFSVNIFIAFHHMDIFIVLWEHFSYFDECCQKQRQEVQLQYYCGVNISSKPVKKRPPKNTIPALKETKIQELAGGGASSSVWIQRLSQRRSEQN